MIATLIHSRPTEKEPTRDVPNLPDPAFRTLIVRNAEDLTATQQATLANFVRRSAGELQVVSTTRAPLFPLVAQGLFLDELYYRLNAVVLEPSRDGCPRGGA